MLNPATLLDEFNLLVSSLYIMHWDLFRISIDKQLPDSIFRIEEDKQHFLNLRDQLINTRIELAHPYSAAAYQYAKDMKNIYCVYYGDFALSEEILATCQLIEDLHQYQRSWDKTFAYPDKKSPLLRDCPQLIEYLDERYKIFNLSAVDLLGDFEFGFTDFTFNIHPFIPYEFNRKLHSIIEEGDAKRKQLISLALQTGKYIPRSSYLSLLLQDYYRGPKFKKDILDNEDGVTEHWRHADDKESLKSKYIDAFFKEHLKRTEFMWTTKDTTKDFVIEEVVSPEAVETIDGENCICVKYIHTQFSLASGNCIHFDGCMNIYDAESDQKRIETNINKRSGVKAKKHMKLFRIDGENTITNDEWILLAGAFFKDNELVQEYFGNELPWQKVENI